jgi:tetratricopeptide (TPR) repeat protein
LWYVHYVLGTRPDVGIINPAGVGGTNILDGLITEYKKDHPKTKLSELLVRALLEERKEKDIYGTYKFPFQPTGTTQVPHGLVYELVDNEDIPDKEIYIATVEADFKKLHIVRRETLLLRDSNLITSEIPLIYSNALIKIADFMTSHYKDYDMAEHYYRRALWIDPENPAGYAGLALSQYQARKDCTNSINNMKEAVALYPVWKAYHLQLYLLYNRCGTDKKTIDNFKKKYRSDFKSDVEKDIKAANTIL